jgi:O-antigen/teichoic acid export membrane protein
MFEMTGQGVKFVGKIKYFNYASLAAIICNLIGNAILVPRFKGVGAALATAVTYIVYFSMGTYYSKKCYPVRYRMKEFVLSLILYAVYAGYATVTRNNLVSAGVGCIFLAVCCIINRKTLAGLWKYGVELAKKYLGKV